MSVVKHISLTGGPCAGKTTALAYLYDHLVARDWRVVLVPEAATIVIGATGRREEERTPDYLSRMQRAVLGLQRDLPSMLGATVEEGVKTVYLYDRAELDNRAYIPAETFDTLILETHGRSTWEVAQQYDAVLHLVTAAEGAEEAYTLSNNEARTETPAEARALDELTRQAWLGHSHYTVISNHGTFEDKLRRCLTATLNVLGEPEPLECERKWILEAKPELTGLQATPVLITQHYITPTLDAPDDEVRVRARTVGTHTTYYRTVKTATPDPSVRIEHEDVISGETYQQLVAYQIPGTRAVRKTRYCFVYEGQHFELDHLTSPVDLWLLEAELITADQEVTLPPSLGVLREVTGDPLYSNSALSRRS